MGHPITKKRTVIWQKLVPDFSWKLETFFFWLQVEGLSTEEWAAFCWGRRVLFSPVITLMYLSEGDQTGVCLQRAKVLCTSCMGVHLTSQRIPYIWVERRLILELRRCLSDNLLTQKCKVTGKRSSWWGIEGSNQMELGFRYPNFKPFLTIISLETQLCWCATMG